MDIKLNKKIDDEMNLKVSKMKPVIKPSLPHKHDGYHELIFLSKGSGIHNIDDTNYEVLSPTGFFLKNGQVHYWDFSFIPEGYVILFKEKVLAPYPKTLSLMFNLSIKFNVSENPDIFLLLNQFYNEFKSGANSIILSAYLNLILLKTLASKTTSTDYNSSLITDYYHFKTLLNDNFIELKQVKDYSGLMNISTYKLNEICTKIARRSAVSIIKERLVVEAKNLISFTSLNIAEIAYKLNFSDPSNFIKFFKTQTNLTPLEYRSKSSFLT